MRISIGLVCVLLAIMAGSAMALNVGSDGSDGILSVTSADRVIDLSLATTGLWNQAGDGNGVYDPEKWAVVFKYDSVYVASNRTVTFTQHPSMAPVVWLVNRGVRIEGTVVLDGQQGQGNGGYAMGGPGGFRGGRSNYWTSTGSPGFGPGGGQYIPGAYGGGGSYGTEAPSGGPTYGNDRTLPLIGGSGGAGPANGWSYGSGGGGGAILIASNRTIDLVASPGPGSIRADGGAASYNYPRYYGSAGSGGAIRLIGNSVTGSASNLLSRSGTWTSGYGNSGGLGRIRIETNHLGIQGTGTPAYTYQSLVNDTADIWPTSDLPTVRVTHIGGQPAPSDPRAGFGTGDVFLVTPEDVEVRLEATNVPVDGSWGITIRLAPTEGDESFVEASFVGGNQTTSTWSATLPTLPVARCSDIQARAHQVTP